MHTASNQTSKQTRRFSKTRKIGFKWHLIFGFLLIFNFLSVKAQAAVLNVPSAQYPTVQSAIDAANPGDTIVLQANTTFTESVILRYKSGSSYITIQTSALSSLPAAGVRVSPTHAQYMPKITSANADPEIRTEITAQGPSHHYKLIGIEIGEFTANGFSYDIINLGEHSSSQNTEAKVAHHFVIDRCYIHAHPDANVRNGIALNSADTTITDSYISEIHDVNSESHGIVGTNGIGRYQILNNYIEASSINVFFGGADPVIPNLVPADILVKRNYVKKKASWLQRNPQWIVKNLFELKNAKRVTVEDNIFDTNWSGSIGRSDQNGTAILFTVRNQEGNAPWSTVEDVTFSKNIVRNTNNGVQILGQDYAYPSQNVKNLNINNNLFLTDGAAWGGAGDCFGISDVPAGSLGTQNLTVDHNSCISAGGSSQVFIRAEDTSKVSGLTVKNNLATPLGNQNLADVLRSGIIGTTALNNLAGNSWAFPNNVLVFTSGYNYRLTQYPTTSFYAQNVSSLGFVDAANGNYALAQNSQYRNAGTDGKDLGADFAYLNQQKSCIETGNWASCGGNNGGNNGGTQTPYPGPSAPSVPTIIEVENYDNGGAGGAYHDLDAGNNGGVYRQDNVDVQARTTASNGFSIFNASAGEWLEYTVNVPTAGVYDIGVSYASEFNNGTFHLEVDGTNVTSAMTASPTGSWGTFQTLTKTGVNLSAGTRVLRLSLDTNSPDGCNCVVANFDKISLQPSSTAPASVAWQNLQGTSSNGGTVQHSGTHYYGLAKTQQTISTGTYFEWTYNGYNDVWVGITNSNNPPQNEFDYSFSGDVREFGVWKEDGFPAAGDRLRIEISSNGTVSFKKNGQVIYTSQTPASGSYNLVFKSQETIGANISNVVKGGI